MNFDRLGRPADTQEERNDFPGSCPSFASPCKLIDKACGSKAQTELPFELQIPMTEGRHPKDSIQALPRHLMILDKPCGPKSSHDSFTLLTIPTKAGWPWSSFKAARLWLSWGGEHFESLYRNHVQRQTFCPSFLNASERVAVFDSSFYSLLTCPHMSSREEGRRDMMIAAEQILGAVR